MTLTSLPLSEMISALIAGAIAWFGGGKFSARSTEVDSAREVLAMWKETSESQKQDISYLRAEVERLNQKIDLFERHIHKIEAENEALRKEVSKNRTELKKVSQS
jgi:septal ring factor EnvC (AmiA/AmiB activator)